MKVFLIILTVLVGITALLCAVLSVRLKIRLDYTDKVNLEIKWAFIKLNIFPLSGKKKKKPEQKKEEPEKTEEKPPEQPKAKKPNPIKVFLNNKGIEGLYEILRQTCSALGGFFGKIVRQIKLDEFFLIMRVSAGDAAQTAIEYGKTCGMVFPMLGYICSHMRVGKYDVDISPDYLASQTTGELHARLSFKPLTLTNGAVVLVFQLLFRVVIQFLRGLKTPKGAQPVQNAKSNTTTTNEGGAS